MNWFHSMYKFHPMLLGMIVQAIATCAITYLPTPTPTSSLFYQWFFNFSHALILAIARIASQYKDNGNQPPPTGGTNTMKPALCFLAILLTFGMTGCSAQQTAQAVSNVLGGILNIAQQEEQALPPQDVAAVTQWVTLGISLDGQANTCIAAAGNTKAKLATCLTTFVGGLLSPTELAQLRILSAATQKKVQLYATAALIAINGALTNWGQPAQPNPTITAATPTAADFRALSARLQLEGYLP